MINKLKERGINISESCNMLSSDRSTNHRNCSKAKNNPHKSKRMKSKNEDEEYISVINGIKLNINSVATEEYELI